MTRRNSVSILAATALAMGIASAALAATQQIPVVRLHNQITVAAPPAAVWEYVTSGSHFATWCPEWKAPANAKIHLTRIGDVVDYRDAWGNGGRSIVTYFDRNHELRVAHEPSKGDYMCQAKVVLEPSGNGTIVHFWEQYTDESGPKDLAATADKMQNEFVANLAALRSSIEKK
jgi:uncharacterized protein YndB with AHSA1/START domain